MKKYYSELHGIKIMLNIRIYRNSNLTEFIYHIIIINTQFEDNKKIFVFHFLRVSQFYECLKF